MALRGGRSICATEGAIFSKMIVFVVPLMLTNIMQQLYSMADNIVVGQFSGDPVALAAIGSTSTFIALLTALLTGFSAGIGAVVSRNFGAKDYLALERGVHTSVILGAVIGIAVCVFGLILSRPILVLLDTKDEFIDKSLLYVRIVLSGIPAVAVMNSGAAILRSVGDSKTPFYTLTASGVLNVLLNLLFVIAFKMAIAGVAIATVVSQYLSAVVIILMLIRRKNEPYSLKLNKLRVDRGVLANILRLGVPAAIQGSLFGITNLCLIRALNGFPTPVLSARTIATNIDVLLSTVINTYLHVAMTFTGQNLGAKKYDRIKKSLFYALLQVVTIGVSVGQLMLIFYEPLVNLYLAPDDPNRAEVLAAAKTIMTVMLSSYFIGAINESLSGFLRGLGNSVAPMIVSVVGICGFRMLWIFAIFPSLNDLVGLYLVYPISWTLTGLGLSIMAIVTYRKIAKSETAVPALQKNDT